MTASTTLEPRGSLTRPQPGPTGFSGLLRATYGSHTFAATDDEVNDKYTLCVIPAGATVIGGYVRAKDLDTGTETLDIDVGIVANGVDAADPDAFGNLGLWSGDAVLDVRPEVGIYYNLGGVLLTSGPQTYTVDTQVQIVVNAAANTLTAGILTVVIHYVFD